MSLTSSDYEQLEQLMNANPHNKELIQKLLDSHQYTLSKISHEIRNPLSLIYSTLQLIEVQHPETKSFKYWNQMREDIEFMIQLLQELSAFNNSERLHKETFSSYEFLSRICLSFAASCPEETISFSSQLSKELPPITGDRLKLQEVLFNLLKNAKEAITEYGSIFFNAFIKDNFLNIQITDTGCGIPQEYLETLFDAFVTYKAEGTGLGLAIADRIVKAHGGLITVSSEIGKGTCFTVILPIT